MIIINTNLILCLFICIYIHYMLNFIILTNIYITYNFLQLYD